MSEALPLLTAQDLRDFANLPSEVPEGLLAQHAERGERELKQVTGLDAAPEFAELVWKDAALHSALASVFPWLNTFALEGAAKVGRLEGAVDARFLDASDTNERVNELRTEFDRLVSVILSLVEGDDEEEAAEETTFGSVSLMAV